MYKAKVYIRLKDGIADPQGLTVKEALHIMGYKEVEEVHIGKFIELKIDPIPGRDTDNRLKEMCDRLLTNPVIEDYVIELVED